MADYTYRNVDLSPGVVSSFRYELTTATIMAISPMAIGVLVILDRPWPTRLLLISLLVLTWLHTINQLRLARGYHLKAEAHRQAAAICDQAITILEQAKDCAEATKSATTQSR